MKKLRRTLSESFRSIAFKKEDSGCDEGSAAALWDLVCWFSGSPGCKTYKNAVEYRRALRIMVCHWIDLSWIETCISIQGMVSFFQSLDSYAVP
ncbi:unnamed protein product [Arctogadus glacialis]